MGLAEKLLIALVLSALIFASGIRIGTRYADNKHAAQQLNAERTAHVTYVEGVKRAIEQADDLAAQNAEAEGAAVQHRAAIERVFQTIDHEVIKYVQTDAGRGMCFDDDGLRLYNAANRGDFPTSDKAAPGGGGYGAMPGSSPSGERFSGGDTANQQGSGAGVSPLPGPAAGADGLGEAQP